MLGCPCVWTAKEKAVGGVTCLKIVSSGDFFFRLLLLVVLNYHVSPGLKLGLEVAEERLWKRKKWEIRMKYLWWKHEEGGQQRPKSKKWRWRASEHQGEGERSNNTAAL